MSFLDVSHLCAAYGDKPILRDISFSVQEGQLWGVLGANGCGKTTLLKSVCGILAHQGRCTLRSQSLESLPPRRLARLCSYIPQRSGISIDLSALDVVLMGFNPRLKLLERPDAAMREAARLALRQVGLDGREDENYLHLSEGQKQLCILARTLVSDASLLLLDEPESALDFQFRYRTLRILAQWLAQPGRAALVALHDPALALNFCDALLLLSPQGSVLAQLFPKTDAPDVMEAQLSRLYGPVSLHRCRDRHGNTHLLMLKEPEDA